MRKLFYPSKWFSWLLFLLLRDLSGASRKCSTLHKPNHWVTPCTTSKQTLVYRWKRAKVSKGECEAAAAAVGLAGLGLARKEDFQTQFILNKMLNNLCYNSQQLWLWISYTKCFGVKTPSSGVLYCTTTKCSSTTILHEFYFGRYLALRAWPIIVYLFGSMRCEQESIFSMLCNVYSLFCPFP